MRALTFDGREISLVANHPEPALEAGEALIRTIKAAAARADVEVCRGLFGFSGVMGHQFVGVVESVRGGAANGWVGRRVVGAVAVVCGCCDLCVRGLSAHCREQTLLGLRGRDGCMAERLALPLRNLTKVPDTVDDDQALFAVPLASAIETARRLAIEGKPYITVLGDGVLGLLMVQVMARLNASVRLVGRYPHKLALCERWGIKHRLVDEVGRRADQDIVVDCTGSSEGLALALELVRPRGKVVLKTLLARTAPGECVDLTGLVLNGIELVGSGLGPVPEAIEMLRRREVDAVSLLGRRIRLGEGPAVLQAAAQPGALRVVVDV